MSWGGNPLEDPIEWDTFLINGFESPGVCDIDSASISYKWDEKEGPGTRGSTTTYRGLKLAHFTIKLRFWDNEQIDEWDDFQKKILELDAKKVPLKAGTIDHPKLTRLGITSVVSENIGALTHEGAGLYSVTVGFIQFNPPKIAKVGTPKKVPVPAEHDPELDAANAEANRLYNTPSKVGPV